MPDRVKLDRVKLDRVRMDKWLWAARFFKTRALAAKACELGRVSSNGIVAKPARDVHAGDMLRVRTEGGEYEIEVLGLSDMRGPAPVAQSLYRETAESKVRRQEELERRKSVPVYDQEYGGRPSKRDRRTLNRFRERY